MTKMKKTTAVLAITAACAGTWVGGNTLIRDVQFARGEAKVQTTRQELQNVQDLSTVFRNVGKAVEPSVVQIVVHKAVPVGQMQETLPNDQLRKFFKDHGLTPPQGQLPDDGEGPQTQPEAGPEEVGTGSGVIIETDGNTAYILTNNHVAGGATEMTVTLADGREIKGGKTIGADPKADLAVVKISADHLIPAKWGDSDQLDRGDWVLAFGSPFGYVGSMTHGIVSALNRQAGILGSQGYENFIQVDAPINPGNSGGPLVNIHGEVVGINTAIASRSGAFSGIGFAIPSDQAKAIYLQLKEHGKVVRGWLGVRIDDVDRQPGLAKSFNYTGEHGVIVEEVMPSSPAVDKLEDGDIVTAVNGKPVENTQQLRNQIAFLSPGSDAHMDVYRQGKKLDQTIKLGEAPENLMAMGKRGSGIAPQAEKQQAVASLGLHLTNINDEMAEKFNLGDLKKGALVTQVEPRSMAFKAGIAAGDVITRVEGKTVASSEEATAALADIDLKKGVRLRISSAEGSHFVFMQQD